MSFATASIVNAAQRWECTHQLGRRRDRTTGLIPSLYRLLLFEKFVMCSRMRKFLNGMLEMEK